MEIDEIKNLITSKTRIIAITHLSNVTGAILPIKKIVDYFNNLDKKPHFIFVSTSHVYDYSKMKLKETSKSNPRNTYAKLKLKSEKYIKNFLFMFSFNKLFI